MAGLKFFDGCIPFYHGAASEKDMLRGVGEQLRNELESDTNIAFPTPLSVNAAKAHSASRPTACSEYEGLICYHNVCYVRRPDRVHLAPGGM